MLQDKTKERAFFNRHAEVGAYNVFSDRANEKILEKFLALAQITPGAHVADLGSGSGIFAHLLTQRGFQCSGVDLSPRLIEVGWRMYPGLDLREGDVEALPFSDGTFDAVLLSGIVHHLPEPARCAAEVYRVLKPGGRFVAFDPNRRNPFMYLYRDRSSPFYSSVGVTENERPVLAKEMARAFEAAGFEVGTEFLSGLEYRYVAAPLARGALPLYNALDSLLSLLPFLRGYWAFVFTFGKKPGEKI